MMEKPNEIINMISSLEQFETTLSNFAPLLASYYKSMIEQGLPEDLAETLVIGWHAIYWTQIWEKTGPSNE